VKRLRDILDESIFGPAKRPDYFKFKQAGAERHARALQSLNIMPKKAHRLRKEARQHELRSKESDGWEKDYFRRADIGKKWFGDRRSLMTKILLPGSK
jgi:hypothetical protein